MKWRAICFIKKSLSFVAYSQFGMIDLKMTLPELSWIRVLEWKIMKELIWVMKNYRPVSQAECKYYRYALFVYVVVYFVIAMQTVRWLFQTLVLSVIFLVSKWSRERKRREDPILFSPLSKRYANWSQHLCEYRTQVSWARWIWRIALNLLFVYTDVCRGELDITRIVGIYFTRLSITTFRYYTLYTLQRL